MSDSRRVLKPDGQAIFMIALTSLEAAVGSLKDGSIEFQILLLIHEHVEQFLLLCDQSNIGGSEQSRLKQLLNQRFIELKTFEEEREDVFSFIKMCSVIKQGNRRKTVLDVLL